MYYFFLVNILFYGVTIKCTYYQTQVVKNKKVCIMFMIPNYKSKLNKLNKHRKYCVQ